MKYKIGDKVKIIKHGDIGSIVDIVGEKIKPIYIVENENNKFYCEEDTIALYYKNNRQWLESLPDVRYARVIQGLLVMWNYSPDIEFSTYLENWLQMEHKGESEKKVCGSCKHYIGGGDYNLCCSKPHPEAIFGFLCYKETEACDMFEKKEEQQED